MTVLDYTLHEPSNVHALPWPARSADLFPMEYLWDMLDRRVRERNPLPQTLWEMLLALHNEWQNIPQLTIQNVLPPCVVVELRLQQEEGIADTEHFDTL